ncbi:hypothetical protein GCM10023149_25970 [Mucilaginibacter gynuensis]|uniref:DUF6265 domain-containing protein n=1 Tax=Mucilaginibacter gynuensis TaxID=1302236 RepID=A0ABP8GHD5_9SPHI
MKNLRTLLLLVLFSGLLPAAYAQTPAKGSFADIAFIQGHWKATTAEGQQIEGCWMPPETDNIVGFMRMMRGGKLDIYEILAYEQTEQGLVSMVKHFKPGLNGLEDKDKQDRYIFVEASKDKAIFQKEGGDLRILYEKRSANQFVIARGNPQDGKYVFVDLFVFNRVK